MLLLPALAGHLLGVQASLGVGGRNQEAPLNFRTQDSRKDLLHSGNSACRENYPILTGLNKREMFWPLQTNSFKAVLLQVMFDRADYRISPRVLLVLASSSASLEYHLSHPVPVSPPFVNTMFLALQALYLHTTINYLVRLGH